MVLSGGHPPSRQNRPEMMSHPDQPGSGPAQGSDSEQSDSATSATTYVPQLDVMRRIVVIQQQRLSVEHLCRVAVYHGDMSLARRHAARAVELDDEHRRLTRALWASAPEDLVQA